MISKGLVKCGYNKITKSGNQVFCLMLTELGYNLACKIEELEWEWSMRMEIINRIFKKNTTNQNIEKTILSYFNELVMG